MTNSTDNSSSQSDSKRRDRLYDMRPALIPIAERWIVDEARLGQSELKIRYQWAKDLQKVGAECDRFGDDAAESLYSLLGDPAVSLLTYRKVAVFIDDAFFDEVVAFNKTCSKRECSITWSHLLLFTQLAETEDRNSLFEQCKAEHWSVATLRSHVKKMTDGDSSKSTTEKRESGANSIAKRVMNTVGQLTKQTQKILSGEFSHSLADVRPGDLQATIELVENARKAMSVCLDDLKVAVEALDEAMEPLNSKLEASEKKHQASEKVVTQVAPTPRQSQAVLKNPNTPRVSPVVSSASTPAATNPSPRIRKKKSIKRIKRPINQGPAAPVVALKT